MVIMEIMLLVSIPLFFPSVFNQDLYRVQFESGYPLITVCMTESIPSEAITQRKVSADALTLIWQLGHGR